ncbi:AsmA-like C-terminal region-containing protein [Ichthyenterobacterium sp. W332]|uniref:AsmA-like C-terminal region-containing protein n=1 Tax=Microcosmobacter mediterraneus TaxID=3075607 RepID=A0ABU2YK55_9FLAO|nr:AsmA-like C-terminal region-containing protein [Ichthyenterobacterium sp. W332]MDT0558543.1 AsmA-like C-terminal region-containing protein [Ichthyenterobacterium sp. W332]
MKKFLKITGILLLIIFAILAVIPLVLESKIDAIVQAYADENLNAKVEFDDISLSLIISFPKANVTIDNLNITNAEPFKGETLMTAKSINFEMPISELWKSESDGPLVVNEIAVDEALLTLKTNTAGVTNYDIIKTDSLANTNTNNTNKGFSFDIKDYSIEDSAFSFIDESSNTSFFITALNHNGHGIFSGSTSELDTKTEANVSLIIDSTSYLSNNSIKLDALIDLDLENSIYTFKDNNGFINQLPLKFRGYVQQLDNAQDVDITFENPESSFKDFLAVIPKAYAKNLDDVETTGDFKVNGKIRGKVSETTIPKLDINITSDNASFKYPDLPKRVENISINTSLKNETGNADDTFIAIDRLNFKIDKDVFKSSATIRQLTSNMMVNANIDGVLNLQNITKVYPIKLENDLQGILKGKVNSSFDMKAIETNAFERIKNNGNLSISNFEYSSKDIVNPFAITKSDIEFKPNHVTLKSFDASSGTSDFKANGTITNLLGFLLSEKKLKGHFNVTSNMFAISDFMIEDTTISEDNKTTSDSESLRIPEFLDCTINANAKTVLYDNLELKNVKGKLVIADQKADLQNMTSDIFDGKLAIGGLVSTKEKTPTFNLNLGANDFDIAQSFKDLELLQNLAPIAKTLQGKLNTTIALNGSLDKSFSPNISTVSGNALAEILTSTVNPLQGDVLEKLSGALSFIDFKKLDLKDVKTKLSFENGQVSVKPFNLKYNDIDVEISGTHGFDESMNYIAVFNVPAKYLGTEINNFISKLNDDSAKDITVPVTATIGGSFKQPTVKTDLTSSVSKLTQQLIEIQKQQIIGKGKDKINELLGGITGNDKEKETDSTTTSTTDTVKGILGGLLGGKKKEKKKDSLNR